MDDISPNETKLEEELRQTLAMIEESSDNENLHNRHIQHIESLKQKHNLIMDQLLVLNEPRRFDPLDRLPIELWHNVLYEVANPGFRPDKKNHYGSVRHSLFVFMLVSRRWRKTILDMPLLWRTVQLDGDIEDWVARVKISLSLSQDLPLYVQIGVPVVGWENVREALIRNRQRIAIIRLYYRSSFRRDEEGAIESLEACINDLLPLPRLTRIAVDIPGQKSLPVVQRLLEQCRSLGEIMRLNLPEEFLQLKSASRLRSFQVTEKLLGAVAQRFPKLYNIKFTYNRDKSNDSMSMVSHSLEWKHLNISSTQDACLISKLTNVVTLTLTADGAVLKELLCRVHLLTKLQYLEFATDIAPKFRDTLPTVTEISPNFSVKTLRIEFINHLFPSDQKELVDAYFDHVQELVLKALPSVEELTMTSRRTNPTQLYDSRTFPRLSTLYLQASPPQTEPMVLSRSIENLHVLSPHHSDYFSAFSSLSLHRLVINYRLSIANSISNDLGYLIEPEKWPSLISLTIPASHLGVQKDAFIFLRNLGITDTVGSIGIDGTNGSVTRVCRDLAVNPTWLPALEHLQVYQLPEWDIFFIMLDRRNITGKPTTPLRMVSLPHFYPKELFGPIHSLLQRKFPRRPSNYDLSLQGSMELLCDNTV
jgi:hypothetical protein